MVKYYLKVAKVSLALCLLSFASILLLYAAIIFVNDYDFSGLAEDYPALAALGACLVFANYALWAWKPRLQSASKRLAAAQAESLSAIKPRFAPAAIILAAAASLFLELVIIRWQASLFMFFSFYKNFSLLACFIGLGIGYARARDKEIPLFFSLAVLAFQVVFMLFIRYGVTTAGHFFFLMPIAEQTGMGVSVLSANQPFISNLVCIMPIYLLLMTTFLLTALVFIPIGQLCGRLMTLTSKLEAYGYNLLGSIIGVLASVALSVFWTPPVIWFALAICCLLLFQQYAPAARISGIAAAAVIICALAWPLDSYKHRLYSPYQLIERTATQYGLMQILAAGTFYQKVYDLADLSENEKKNPELSSVQAYYDFPYKFLPKDAKVAIVGAGSGNDVAAALRGHASNVKAVEIDPAIIYLGEHYHPEHPYDDPRVDVINNDARTYFRRTNENFDLIVYGALDSHGLLSHAASIRVDSYVYTREGFREAFALLKDGGLMSVSFALLNDKMGGKIFRMLEELGGKNKPVAIHSSYDMGIDITTFLLRKNASFNTNDVSLFRGFNDVTQRYASVTNVDIPTDDWPFFYMGRRVYPLSCVLFLGLILGLTVYLVRTTIPMEEFSMRYMPFFFLGAGFMLIETKAITELGLMFGNTWQVIALTIVCILVMAYLANLLVSKVKIPSTGYIYAVLFALILLSYYLVAFGGLKLQTGAGAILFAAFITLPVFFSGLIFSKLLGQGRENISGIMAFNLVGAMLGGALEYNAMYFGYAFLYLLAFVLYALAFVTGLAPRR